MSIEDVLDAFHDYEMAKGEHDSSLSNYEGYSWDYHGFALIEKMNNSRAAAEKALNEYIDARIDAKAS